VKVIAVNLVECWSRDVTEDIARAALEHARHQGDLLGRTAREFYEFATGEAVPADVAQSD
jgi:hypothetical protein